MENQEGEGKGRQGKENNVYDCVDDDGRARRGYFSVVVRLIIREER